MEEGIGKYGKKVICVSKDKSLLLCQSSLESNREGKPQHEPSKPGFSKLLGGFTRAFKVTVHYCNARPKTF